MNQNIKDNLKMIRSKVSIERTTLSYIEEILNAFIKDPKKFNDICTIYDLEEYELLLMLANYNKDYIHLYDEMYEKIKTKKIENE